MYLFIVVITTPIIVDTPTVADTKRSIASLLVSVIVAFKSINSIVRTLKS